MFQVRDDQGLSLHFPELTDGQFPPMLRQTRALSVTVLNCRFTITSDAFAAVTVRHDRLEAASPTTPSLTSTYCCSNSGSTSLTLARIMLAGHKTPGKTMDRDFEAGLHRVTLQWLYIVLSR